MAYTIRLADEVAATLGKQLTMNRFQLAGQFANIDFWVDEVKHVLSVIDGYSARLALLESAQQEYIDKHDVDITDERPYSAGSQNNWGGGEQVPRSELDRYRVDPELLKAKRQKVADAFYYVLRRYYKEGILTGQAAKDLLTNCQLNWKPDDFA
ncbi:hypothetical protein [Aeoliella mucimassa]|uniref:Uncharacterized protein n=1 Tax=Aeoliella mucimassa TaxID=2527972 RepID=A0A518AV26_9BACT|nr:hypothetical protein [Aeoliella mucimassa]QDU58574.1 hypothetical protein Pan181_48130 [Aeoliella mucimassa]